MVQCPTVQVVVVYVGSRTKDKDKLVQVQVLSVLDWTGLDWLHWAHWTFSAGVR